MSTRPARDTHERDAFSFFSSSLSLCPSVSVSVSPTDLLSLFKSMPPPAAVSCHSLPSLSSLPFLSLCLFNLWLKSNLITGRDASPSLTSFRAPDVFHEKKVFLLSIPSPVTLVVFLFSLSLGSRSKV